MDGRIEKLNDKNAGLAWNFYVSPASCENPDYFNLYIRLSAMGDMQAGRGTTHLFIGSDESGDKLLGFITLRATSYIIKQSGEKAKGEPAMEIYEVAVSEDAEGLGIGSKLVKFAILTAHDLSEETLGIRYILLCATEKAVPFYERLHFKRMSEQGEVPRDNTNENCVPMYLKIGI